MSDWTEFAKVAAISGAAACTAVAGGLLAIWRKPTTLFMSAALGFASGVLLATISLEMIPKALELGSLPITVGGFLAGFSFVYGFDLFVHRGKLAGPAAQQHRSVERFHRYKRPRGTEVTVLAGGTSVEELIEGLSIGVGAAIEPSIGIVVGTAIAIDNLSEGLSIGELVRAESSTHPQRRRILAWCAAMGFAVLISALLGWLFLRNLSGTVLAFLLASGAGGMLYLTVTSLVPQAEERQYQQSAAISIAAGFIVVLLLSQLQ